MMAYRTDSQSPHWTQTNDIQGFGFRQNQPCELSVGRFVEDVKAGRTNKRLIQFLKERSFVLHVISRISDEQGLDKLEFEKTLPILNDIAKNINGHTDVEPWPVEGRIIVDKKVSTRSQMIQHYKAVMHLLQRSSDDELTGEELCKIHSILFHMAEADDESRLEIGRFRSTIESSERGFTFVEPDRIPIAVESALKRYENRRAICNRNGYAFNYHLRNVVRLFFDLLTIHPFVTGNDSLCLLVLSYGLLREGFPFFMSLTTVKGQAYLHAIDNARKHAIDVENQDLALYELRALVVSSLQANIDNYRALRVHYDVNEQ